MLDSIRPWSWPLRKLRGTYQYLFLRWEDWVPHLLQCIVIMFLGCPFDIFKLPELVWILFDCLVFYRVFYLEIMSLTIYYPKYRPCLWAEIQFSWLLYLSYLLVSKLNCHPFFWIMKLADSMFSAHFIIFIPILFSFILKKTVFCIFGSCTRPWIPFP